MPIIRPPRVSRKPNRALIIRGVDHFLIAALFIAAHRDTHFRVLKNVKTGDEIVVTTAQGERIVFVIDETRIVDAAQSGLYAGGAAPRIALVTCWPFDSLRRGNQRFVAIGVLK